ncbi:hypothetical protein HEP87_49505 [Streptomyces sp. S1D4-11]|nr:hypothetical protein [Streptomyces sp. S1D4-11]QIZ00392.1 hypothetical protein HEP87_49505 [Streptomyces sp. S1D4-11]
MTPPAAHRTYALLGPDGQLCRSGTPGVLGGHRPCAVCLPGEYARWKSTRESSSASS